MEKLSSIASIFTGYTFREKVKNDDNGSVYVIQLKDLEDDYSVIKDNPHLVTDSGFGPMHLLQKGDVLFIAKGQNNFAILYDKEFEKAVASSIFFVLRPNKELVNSEYLTWYINQSEAQAFLHKGKEGTLITNINKQSLSELIIKLPPVKVQEKVAKISRLFTREQYLTKLLMEKKRVLMERILLKEVELHEV